MRDFHKTQQNADFLHSAELLMYNLLKVGPGYLIGFEAVQDLQYNFMMLYFLLIGKSIILQSVGHTPT